MRYIPHAPQTYFFGHTKKTTFAQVLIHFFQ
nr:MAG TPA: hypothetical protein [Caudoviricetes sp.]